MRPTAPSITRYAADAGVRTRSSAHERKLHHQESSTINGSQYSSWEGPHDPNFRTLTVATILVLGLTAMMPAAQAASLMTARPTHLNEALTDVGDRWQQVLPTGERVTFEKVSAVESRSVTPVKMAAAQCPHLSKYLCAWQTSYQTGTMWLYNLDNVYANTANGVAHCWNMAADANNNTKSWYNAYTQRSATLYNWVNCNQASEKFLVRFNESGGDYDLDCGQISPGNWCTTLFPTSIKASV